MDVNVACGPNWTERDLEVIFQDEHVQHSRAHDYPSLLVELGIYPSTSAARRAGREGPIPKGYAELRASKRHFLFLWNPSE